MKEKNFLYVKASFARQVQDLCFKLSSILQDTRKVSKLVQTADAETIQDLFYQIALSYSDTPQIRITWLEALSKLHVKVLDVVPCYLLYARQRIFRRQQCVNCILQH